MYSYFNRDLSWISFNYRVLSEAKDPKVPLLERLRFLAIYSSNLDEFFRVRVTAIRSINAVGKRKIHDSVSLTEGITEKILSITNEHLNEYGQILENVLQGLETTGIFFPKNLDDLELSEKHALRSYFKTNVLAYLRPHIFEKSKISPFLNNQQLYLALRLADSSKEYFGYVNIPSDVLPRFYYIKKAENSHYFIYLDDIIRYNIESVFPKMQVLECKSIKLNKDASLHIEDEYSGDLVEKIEKQIEKRNLGIPARFLYDKNMSDAMLSCFQQTFNIQNNDLVAGGRYHNLSDYFQVFNPTQHEICYPKVQPANHNGLDQFDSILKSIELQDHLLHFPYQSYDYVLRFFNEAAIDSDVEEIYVTFYRMAKNSLIGEALISAANNGKKVIVFMELKARFDEANNLFWSSRMKAAGIKIIYSFPGLKVHAKIALVRKKDVSFGFLGTGNLNEKTAATYCDYGLLTSDSNITADLHKVFKFLHKRKDPKNFKNLVVSQFNAIERFCSLIDREIDHVKTHHNASLIIKVNNLEDRNLINKLYEAAEAGVKVTLIVRSICCLIPDSYGIKVIRLVGRYLEHARIFYFENAGKSEVYLGSSDWMSRNLYRRVEVSFPIKNEVLKTQIMDILHLQISDNLKAVRLDENLNNLPQISNDEKPINAQLETQKMIQEWYQ